MMMDITWFLTALTLLGTVLNIRTTPTYAIKIACGYP